LRVAGVKIDPQKGVIEIVTGDEGGQDSTRLVQEGNEWDAV
jgi:hypothetical protein